MMPPPDLKARVFGALAAQPAPTRAVVVRGILLSGYAATAIPLVIFFGIGGPHARDRPAPFVAATAAGWVFLALVATWSAVRRGSMVGGSRAALLVWALTIPVALLGWYALSLSLWQVASEPVPLAQAAGCFVLTLAMAAVPFALFARFRRGSDPVHPRATGAAIGALAGAWASVLIGLHCEYVEFVHVAVGHVLPVVLLAGLGALVGGRVIGMRQDPVIGAPTGFRRTP